MAFNWLTRANPQAHLTCHCGDHLVNLTDTKTHTLSAG